jgi:anti-anti-sigma factor
MKSENQVGRNRVCVEKRIIYNMGIDFRIIGEFCIIDLACDTFSGENMEKLKSTINEIISNGSSNILLNMANIMKIDGTGLGTLLGLQKIAHYNEVNIRLFGLKPYVAQIIFQTRLNKVLDICQLDDELYEEALTDGLIAV